MAERYDLGHIDGAPNSTGIEFEKLRFEYLWRHFDMHCRQRLQMFYFFLISVAFLCGALATAEANQKTGSSQLLTIIPIIGIGISVVFFLLDGRNRALYSNSCRHLEALESNVLFPANFRELLGPGPDGPTPVKGIMLEDAAIRSRFFRHRYLIPLCHIGGGALFALLLLRIYKVF